MDLQRTALTKQVEPIDLAALVEAAWLPGVRDVRASTDVLYVSFVEADFVIRLSSATSRDRGGTPIGR